MGNEVVRMFDGVPVAGRDDGYVNATALCRAAGKQWADYWRLKHTQEVFKEASANMGIPILALAVSKVGGNHSGTWVHPDLIGGVAAWASPKFAFQVSRWVRELLTTGRVELPNAAPPMLPWGRRITEHFLGFKAALLRAHPDRWAVATEVMAEAFVIEDELAKILFPLDEGDRPDGSIGRRWSDRRAELGLAPEPLRDVAMTTPEPLRPFVFPATYPNAELPAFREWFGSIYMPMNLPDYLVGKAKRQGKDWREAGVLPPPPAKIVTASEAACVRTTGRRLSLSGKMLEWRDQGELFGR